MNRHFRLQILVLSIVAGTAATAFCEDTSHNGNVIADYDMREYGEFWSLPLTLYGNTYRFLVDTGTGLVVFDESLRHLLGKPLKQKALNSSIADKMAPLFTAPDARVDKLPIERRAYVACVDLAALKESSGGDIAGLLGSAFLRKHIVQFDFDCARLRFLASVPEGSGHRVAFDGDFMRPHCRCSFEAGGEDSFMLDSGGLIFFSVSLRDDLFQQLVDEASAAQNRVVVPRLILTGSEPHVDAFGELRRRQCGILRRLEIGQLNFEGLRVSSGRFSTLGLRFMSRFVVTIDFPNRNIYFRPIDGADRDDFDGGVVIARNGKRTFITGVVPLGRAVGLHLSPDDELLSVNGIETESTNLFALRRILGRKEEAATLDIKRADGTEATVRLPGRD